jgi:hypothetical protein
MTPEGHLWLQQLHLMGHVDDGQVARQELEQVVALRKVHKPEGAAGKRRKPKRNLDAERVPMHLPLGGAVPPPQPTAAHVVATAVSKVAAASRAHRKRFARMVLCRGGSKAVKVDKGELCPPQTLAGALPDIISAARALVAQHGCGSSNGESSDGSSDDDSSGSDAENFTLGKAALRMTQQLLLAWEKGGRAGAAKVLRVAFQPLIKDLLQRPSKMQGWLSMHHSAHGGGVRIYMRLTELAAGSKESETKSRLFYSTGGTSAPKAVAATGPPIARNTLHGQRCWRLVSVQLRLDHAPDALADHCERQRQIAAEAAIATNAATAAAAAAAMAAAAASTAPEAKIVADEFVRTTRQRALSQQANAALGAWKLALTARLSRLDLSTSAYNSNRGASAKRARSMTTGAGTIEDDGVDSEDGRGSDSGANDKAAASPKVPKSETAALNPVPKPLKRDTGQRVTGPEGSRRWKKAPGDICLQHASIRSLGIELTERTVRHVVRSLKWKGEAAIPVSDEAAPVSATAVSMAAQEISPAEAARAAKLVERACAEPQRYPSHFECFPTELCVDSGNNSHRQHRKSATSGSSNGSNGSGADRCGLKQGDILVLYNGLPIVGAPVALALQYGAAVPPAAASGEIASASAMGMCGMSGKRKKGEASRVGEVEQVAMRNLAPSYFAKLEQETFANRTGSSSVAGSGAAGTAGRLGGRASDPSVLTEEYLRRCSRVLPGESALGMSDLATLLADVALVAGSKALLAHTGYSRRPGASTSADALAAVAAGAARPRHRAAPLMLVLREVPAAAREADAVVAEATAAVAATQTAPVTPATTAAAGECDALLWLHGVLFEFCTFKSAQSVEDAAVDGGGEAAQSSAAESKDEFSLSTVRALRLLAEGGATDD